jgi:surface protein
MPELLKLQYDFSGYYEYPIKLWLPIIPEGKSLDDFTMIINDEETTLIEKTTLTQSITFYDLVDTVTIIISGDGKLALSNIEQGTAHEDDEQHYTYSDKYLTKCLSWDGVSSLSNAFCRTTNLNYIPSTLPSGVTDLSYMFASSTVNVDVTSLVSNVDNVTDMSYMFASSKFDQDIRRWDVSKVTNMSYMFSHSTFDNYIYDWNVKNVTLMKGMFQNCPFNHDLSGWIVNNVTNMSYMFSYTSFFDQDIMRWDVSNVTDMSYMFHSSVRFNRSIDNWDVSNVTDMSYMFHSSDRFNQSIDNWDVSKVTNMSNMFSFTSMFNQDISNLIQSNTINISNMVSNSRLNIHNYDLLLEALVRVNAYDNNIEPFGGNLLVYSTNLPIFLTFIENIYSSTSYFEYGKSFTLTIKNTKDIDYSIYLNDRYIKGTYINVDSITFEIPSYYQVEGNNILDVGNEKYSLTQIIYINPTVGSNPPTVSSNPVSSVNNQLNAYPPNTFIPLSYPFKRHFGIDSSRQVIGISLGSILPLTEGIFYIPIIIDPTDKIIIKNQEREMILSFINNIPYLDGKRLYENETVRIDNYLLKVLHIGSLLFEIEYVPTSPICFPSGTPITTDQGNFPIETLTTQTIKGYPIDLTKTISPDSYLVCFEKHSLSHNIPSTKTILSKNHRVDFGYHRLKANDYIGMFDGIYKIPYHKQPLYNVLLPIHSTMKVNHMTCETLHPNHIIAKIHKKCGKEQTYILSVLERLLKQKKLNAYRSAIASL